MNKIKLLIAEDDKLVQRLYSVGISEKVFETRMVSDGDEALKNYDSWKPDIMVLDIVMPFKTGYDVLKKIRESDPVAKKLDNENDKKKTVIIMVTAMGAKEDIMDCLKLGINGYIVKPIKHKEISDKILNYYNKLYSEG